MSQYVVILKVSPGCILVSMGYHFPDFNGFTTTYNCKLPAEVRVPRDGTARGILGALDIRSWGLSKFCESGGWELSVLKGDGANVNKSIYRHICAEYRGVCMMQARKA